MDSDFKVKLSKILYKVDKLQTMMKISMIKGAFNRRFTFLFFKSSPHINNISLNKINTIRFFHAGIINRYEVPGAEAPKQTESPRANREELPKMSLKQYQLIRSYMREKEETYNRRTTINYSLSMMMIFLALTYASVPIYRAICQRTGWGGTPITDKNRFTRDKLSPVSTERKLRVSFTAETSGALPWKFVPQQREVWLVPGETALAFYKAKNVGDRDITGMATYSVTPDHVAPYFNKIQCFCFEEQRLQKGEEVDMPLFFFIDPEFSRDPAMRNIDDVVLHYTFFRAKHDQQHETLFGNADSKNEETTAAHST